MTTHHEDQTDRGPGENEASEADRITMAEAARLKGVSYHTVSRAVRKGTLPVVRLGRMALISPRDLQAWSPMRERAPRKYRRRPPGDSTGTGINLVTSDQVDLAKRLAALYDVIHSASREGSLETIAEVAVRHTAEAFQLTRMSLWRLDESANLATRLATFREPLSDFPPELPLDQARYMMEMIQSGGSMVIENMRAEQRAEHAPYIVPDGPVASFPLVRHDQVVGLMFGDRHGEPIDFSEAQLALADGIANQMAMAIGNAMLRESELRRRLQLETILDELTGAVSAFDENGALMLSNATERRLFDLDDDQARLGQQIDSYLRGKRRFTLDGEPVSIKDNPASRALRGERLQAERYIVVDKSGKRTPVRTNARPLMVDGQIVGAVCVTQDISQEIDAEKRDRASMHKLERAANRSQEVADLMVEITSGLDTKSVADSALRRISQVLGADSGLLMLRDPDGLYRSHAIYGVRADRIPTTSIDVLARPSTAQAFAQHRPTIVSASLLDIPDRLRDTFDDNADMMIIPLQIRGNRLGVAYIGFHSGANLDESDLTFSAIWGRQCAQAIDKVTLIEQLEFAHGRLMTIIDQLVQAVIILDAPDGNVVMANRAAETLWGRTFKRNGLVASNLPVVDDEGGTLEGDAHPLMNPLRTTEKIVGQPMTVVRPDGEHIGVLASHSPLFDVRGDIMGSVSVMQDRADFKPLDRAKDEFISVVAHELRNPLTSLRGNLQLLQRRIRKRNDESSASDMERLDSVITQVDRVGDLVSRMLDVSRVDMGSLDVSVAPVDAGELVRTAATETQGLSPDRRVEFSGPESLPVVWDAARIQQMLSNLVQNAARYAPEGPVEVDLSITDEDRIIITVRDHGPGVPKRIRERLFKQYYRFDDGQDSTSHAADGKRGLGIGLYISARLARAHGGALSVDDAVGGGAIFTLDLPRDASSTES